MCSGDDSGLENVWDEICVQVQDQESVVWDAYEDTVRMLIRSDLKHLSALEREAIWLQTDRGFDWWYDQDNPDEQQSNDGDATPPVCLDDIAEFVLKKILNRAANWSNPRIRAFIESRYEMD